MARKCKCRSKRRGVVQKSKYGVVAQSKYGLFKNIKNMFKKHGSKHVRRARNAAIQKGKVFARNQAGDALKELKATRTYQGIKKFNKTQLKPRYGVWESNNHGGSATNINNKMDSPYGRGQAQKQGNLLKKNTGVSSRIANHEFLGGY